MPVYDYKCVVCKEEFEKFSSLEKRGQVKHCGKRAKKLFKTSRVDVFKPMWYEHLAPEPILITSKGQLREEAKKRGLIAERVS